MPLTEKYIGLRYRQVLHSLALAALLTIITLKMGSVDAMNVIGLEGYESEI